MRSREDLASPRADVRAPTPIERVARWRARLAGALARWRVPLGFACAVVAVWLARPTWASLAVGAPIACAGEALRIWAAGHLEKGREVTSSGPYRLVSHPLYAGSALMGLGFMVGAASPTVALVVGAYLAATLIAAMRSEEAFLRARFGDRYDAYRRARNAAPSEVPPRAFSWRRALGTNREQRSVIGLVVILAVLAVKAALRSPPFRA